MLEPKKTKSVPRAVIPIVAVVMCVVVFLIRRRAILPLVRPLMCISDAMTSIGLVYVILAVIMLAVNKGALDALLFIGHSFLESVRKKGPDTPPPTDFYEYTQRKKKKNTAYRLFLLIGLVLFLAGLSIVLFFDYK